MKIDELLNELEGQNFSKWDERVPSNGLVMTRDNGSVGLSIAEKEKPFGITDSCHQQIAERLDIPVRYYNRMASEAPDLLVENVNQWFTKEERTFFVRGLNGSVRALLSDRYRVIDHLDVLNCALNELQTHEATVESCHLSETEMNVKVRSDRLKDYVRNRDDVLIGGLLLTNSETGHKALRLEPRLYRVACTNGMVVEQFVSKQVHLGTNNGANDSAVYISIRQSIQNLFNQFGEIVQSIRLTTEVRVKKPVDVIHNVVSHYHLTEEQKGAILIAFGAEPDADQYGIANAVTRAAHVEENWEKSLELERLGGNLLALPMKDFQAFDA